MALFTRHSQLAQTAYSELKRRALEQDLVVVGTPGTAGEREVNGGRFAYRQFYDAMGKKSAEYLGAVGRPETEARERAVRAAIELTNVLIADTRELARYGYVRVDGKTRSILAVAANHGLFRGGVVLVGSHVYGALLNDLGVRAAGYLTEDVDVACTRPLAVTLGEGVSFESMLAESTVPLEPVPALERKSPSTSYKAKGTDRLRVDLLVPVRGTEIVTRAVPELRAHATGLPHLDYLLAAPLDGVALGRDGVVPVKLPRAERFAWHKMLVSRLRGATREKRRKDVEQATVLTAALADDAPEDLERAFGELPRGTRSSVREAADQVMIRLAEEGAERARELLAAIV